MRELIGDIVTVTVDRPLGSYHPEYKDMYYPINYGYIEGIMAPDGEEQDAYILGVDKPVEKFTGKIIAIVHRKDDVEEKWVVCPENTTFSRKEIEKQIVDLEGIVKENDTKQLQYTDEVQQQVDKIKATITELIDNALLYQYDSETQTLHVYGDKGEIGKEETETEGEVGNE